MPPTLFHMPRTEGSYGVKSLALLQTQRTFTDFYAIQTPTFMPYEPILLGMRVVFKMIEVCLFQLDGRMFQPPCVEREMGFWRVGEVRVAL